MAATRRESGKRRKTGATPATAASAGRPIEQAFGRYFHVTTNAPSVWPAETWAMKCRHCGGTTYLTPAQLGDMTEVLKALNEAHEAHRHGNA